MPLVVLFTHRWVIYCFFNVNSIADILADCVIYFAYLFRPTHTVCSSSRLKHFADEELSFTEALTQVEASGVRTEGDVSAEDMLSPYLANSDEVQNEMAVSQDEI